MALAAIIAVTGVAGAVGAVGAPKAAADSCPVAEAGFFWRMKQPDGTDAQATGVRAAISIHDHSYISNCVVWGDTVSAAMGQTTRFLLQATPGDYDEVGWKLRLNSNGGHYASPFAEASLGGNGYQLNPPDIASPACINVFPTTVTFESDLIDGGSMGTNNNYYNCGSGNVFLASLNSYGAYWGSPEGEVFQRGSSGVLNETQSSMSYVDITSGVWQTASDVRCRRDTSNSTATPGLAHYYSGMGGVSRGNPSGFTSVDQGTAGSVDCGTSG